MQIYMKDGKALKINGGGYLSPKASGETWVLNEILRLGHIVYTTSFTSNSTRYSKITVFPFSNSRLKYDSTIVYNTSGWINQAYRKITFDTPPTGDILVWLRKNGTKQ